MDKGPLESPFPNPSRPKDPKAMSSTSNAVLRADQVWMDGEFQKWDDAKVPVMTHALHYGLGTFEGIRAYKTKDGRLAIFRLKEHIERLYDSAHMIMLKMPH